MTLSKAPTKENILQFNKKLKGQIHLSDLQGKNFQQALVQFNLFTQNNTKNILQIKVDKEKVLTKKMMKKVLSLARLEKINQKNNNIDQ